ncbi:MAG: trimethylamine methyltransferase family protein, partial [Anaerolineae bacterium]
HMVDRVVPVKQPLLSEAQRQAIHDGALALLDRVGLQVESADLRQALAGQPGVSVDGNWVRFRPALIESLLQRPEPDAWQPAAGHRIHLGSGCCASHVVDPDTDEIRPITWDDLVGCVQLIDAMHGLDVGGHCPGFPQDVPADMQALAEYVIGALYGRGGPSFTAPCPLEAYEYLIRMDEVLGRETNLPLYVISPLRLMGDSYEVVRRYIGRVKHFSVGSMPVMGATAPIHLPSAFMQSLAEGFGGMATIKLLQPEAEVSWGFMAFPLDMKYGSIVYGSPEMNLCDMVRLEMAAFYGRSGGGTRSIRSMAKRPGIQAAMERAGSAVAGALMGSRSFFGAGTLSVDEVFSPEQLVLDREIADYAGRFAQGVSVTDADFDIGEVEAGATGGDFMGRESTLNHFRQAYWLPRLSERRMLNGWLAGGADDIRDRAREEMRRLVSAYDFQLPSEQARALRLLYREAAESLVGGSGLPAGRAEP